MMPIAAISEFCISASWAFGLMAMRFMAAKFYRAQPAGISAFRWHLHPLVQASLMQNGQSALLRTASGNGWRFRIDRGELGLEPSIYCGNGTPRRSLQSASVASHGRGANGRRLVADPGEEGTKPEFRHILQAVK